LAVKRKIRTITAFKVVEGYRGLAGRYQSKARMWLPISD